MVVVVVMKMVAPLMGGSDAGGDGGMAGGWEAHPGAQSGQWHVSQQKVSGKSPPANGPWKMAPSKPLAFYFHLEKGKGLVSTHHGALAALTFIVSGTAPSMNRRYSGSGRNLWMVQC